MFLSRYKEKINEIKKKKQQGAAKNEALNGQIINKQITNGQIINGKIINGQIANEQITNKEDIIRKHMQVYGQVQGVGFRYSARYSALELGVTGWVRNEWDGSVEMEVQGPERQIHRLLQMLNSGKFISIEKIDEKIIPMVEGERKFEVR